MKQFIRRNNRLALDLALVFLTALLLFRFSPELMAYVSRLLGTRIQWTNWHVAAVMFAIGLFAIVRRTVGWQKLIARRLRYEKVWTNPIWGERETRIAKALQVANRVLYVALTTVSVFVFILVITEDLNRTIALLKPYWWLFVFAAVWHGMWPWLSAELDKIHAMFWAPRFINWLVRKGLLYGLILSLEFSVILTVFAAFTGTSPKAVWAQTSMGVIRTIRSVTYLRSDPNVCTNMVENHTYVLRTNTADGIPFFNAEGADLGTIRPNSLVRFKSAGTDGKGFTWYRVKDQKTGVEGYIDAQNTTCRAEYIELSP